ncbi:MAG: tyrosine-type recombinase/integrase [Candidatus Hodarchaeota archaeon]
MRGNERIKRLYFEELELYCSSGLAKLTTFIQRKKAVKMFVEFINRGSISLKRLDSLHIQAFLQYLSTKKSVRGTNYAPPTVKQIYALVKSFYIRCYERNLASKHPDLIFTRDMLRRFKLGERKLPKYIDQEKMQKLLSECPDKWKALLHFMYDTGARISEVLGVQRKHLDFKRKVVQIHEPKTMNVRVTSLSNKTIQLLQDYLNQHRPKPRSDHESFVFINQQRRRMSPRAVQYLVRKVSGKILGVKDVITPHYFRAACAVHLLERGVDIRQVQEIIGWKSLSVVQNYTRVTVQRQAQLKSQHHPGFLSQSQDDISSKRIPLTSSHIDRSPTAQIEEQRRYLTELDELKQIIKQERQRREEEALKQEQERQSYEHQIADLIKSQQQLNEVVKSLLAQKSS